MKIDKSNNENTSNRNQFQLQSPGLHWWVTGSATNPSGQW